MSVIEKFYLLTGSNPLVWTWGRDHLYTPPPSLSHRFEGKLLSIVEHLHMVMMSIRSRMKMEQFKVCLSVFLSVCLPVCLSSCLSVCLSVIGVWLADIYLAVGLVQFKLRINLLCCMYSRKSVIRTRWDQGVFG